MSLRFLHNTEKVGITGHNIKQNLARLSLDIVSNAALLSGTGFAFD